MDFGEILDEWSRRENESGQKKANPQDVSRKEDTLEAVNPMTSWMRIHGTEDKDAELEDNYISKADRRRRLLRKRPDAVIDIHGLTRDEAWLAMDAFFSDACQKEFEKLLIVHGKGNHSDGEAILKRSTREFIERCPFAGESGPADPASGGNGATWVLIKSTANKRA